MGWLGILGACAPHRPKCAILGCGDSPPIIYIYWPDVDVDSNNDGTIDPDNTASGTDDKMEYVAYPPDPNAPDPLGKVMGVNDLAQVNLHMPFADDLFLGHNMTFSWPGVQLWDSPTKNNLYTWTPNPPATDVPYDNWWVIGDEIIPPSVWIEAIYAGGAILTFGLQGQAFDQARVTVVEVDLDTDSNNNGVIDTVFPASDQEDAMEMQAPGKVLIHNIDDDNGNGLADWQDAPFVDAQGQPMNDDDLQPATLDIDPPGANLMGHTVELVPGNEIRLWSTQDKQPLDLTYTIGTDVVPTTIFVEGFDPGQAQLALILRNPQGNEVHRDTVLFTVIYFEAVAYRPQTEGGYDDPFPKTAVPAAQKFNPGVGIRFNGDDDNGNSVADWDDSPVWGDNDVIEVDLINVPNPAPGIEYVVRRSNNNLHVWETDIKTGPILRDDNTAVINPTTPTHDLWVEWTNRTPGALVSDLTIEARAINTQNVVATDTIRFWPFQSVVIAFLGRGNNPPDATDGAWLIAYDLYQLGYDAHAYNEESVDAVNNPPKYEVRNAVDNRNVTQVGILGYSWGGGATYVLADQLVNDPITPQRPWTLPFTAYIDAIRQDSIAAETRLPPRPPNQAPYHVNYYQRHLPLRSLPTDQPSINVNVNATTWGVNLDHDSAGASIDSNLTVQTRIMFGFSGPAGGGNVIHDGIVDRLTP